MDAERAEALEVLRVVWRGQGQDVADLDDNCESHCKKMTDAGVGYEHHPELAPDTELRELQYREDARHAQPLGSDARS